MSKGKAWYLEQLKKKEWKEFSDKVKERASWKCEHCGAIDKPLDAHHEFYVSGRAPWQYNLEAMKCLCHKCHSKIHENMSKIDITCANCACKIVNNNYKSINRKYYCLECLNMFTEEEKYILEECANTCDHCFTKFFDDPLILNGDWLCPFCTSDYG